MHLARKFLVAGLIAAAAALVAVFAAPLGTARSAGAAPTLSFAAPVLVGTGGSEPGIVQSPDGNLFINAPDGLLANGTSPSFVFRSNAQGLSWTLTPPGARSNNPGGGVRVEAPAATLWSGAGQIAVGAGVARQQHGAIEGWVSPAGWGHLGVSFASSMGPLFRQ